MEIMDTEESSTLRAVWREFYDRYMREAEQQSDRSTDPNARIDFMMLRRDLEIADREFGEALAGLLDALGEQTARGDRGEEKWRALSRAVDTLESATSDVRFAFDAVEDESL